MSIWTLVGILFGGLLIAIVVNLGLVASLRKPEEDWRVTVERYQALIGGVFVFLAAAVALIGIYEQIGAERVQQLEIQDRRRHQIAAAFIGDISSIMAEVNSDAETKNLDITLKALQTSADKIASKFLVRFEYLYKSNASDMGLFNAPVPEWITSFYNTYFNLIAHNDVLVETAEKENSSISRPYLFDVAKEEVNLIRHTYLLGCALLDMLTDIRDGKPDRVQSVVDKYSKQGITSETITDVALARSPVTCPCLDTK
jgi:hypothetical protein